MQVCQNPNCSNPFNPDGNKFCISCGCGDFSTLLRNRFRVQKVIGEGGFGRTYLAEDTDRLDAACVIKQFLPQFQGTAALNKGKELFKQEAKSLFALGENHTQIPRLLAYFEQGSGMYLVQEFIEGENLLAELKQQTFDEPRIRQLLDDLLPVLQFVHENNVIHRDIKPENIIRRRDGKLVLIDFGGAKQVTQTSLARQGTGIHTIGYAPTEQMQGYASPASDLYALGATCARLITKCIPLQDAQGIIHDKLGRVLDKLLKHFARERYQSAAEVINDLHSPVFSPPATIIAPPQPVQANQLSVNVSTPQQPVGNPSQKSTPPQKKPGLPLKTFSFETVTVNAQGNIVNRRNLEAKYFVEDLGNSVTLEMVEIPGGTFMMGSPEGEEGRYDSESPQHQVTVPSFYMGKYVVTQAQYEAIMGKNPSRFKGKKRPVERVSWNDAVTFCQRLSHKTRRTYRLPSEAEWEYACRAGTKTPFYFGETITSDLANYDGKFTYASAPKGEYRKQTTDVGTFPPNRFGLYDMHGNVWEWCADSWHDNYKGAPTDGGVWLENGNNSCSPLRGGSWLFYPSVCRSAYRYDLHWAERDSIDDDSGFRVVCAVGRT
ncbi:bifunctional serine/threonine-protein kinase/formylglycine-generating enzyme family protein [Calothrix rhizosoleniae]|uniref:bifunctional serine/threonine-protein kinase/formylglycine-generating enzyme family protein n=1 Tax=Calothrix rhizosoleniae TaxID=888997 RepID=UPI000B49CC7F|nr:bifunctional serine/threonine-protein kinase/formylglycine-generating enzyme family protein [Calothrix rhizosoleniae]